MDENIYYDNGINQKRSKTKYILIGLVLIIAIIAVTGYLARGEILKMVNPAAYLTMAASNTAKEIKTDSFDNEYYDLLRNIYAGSFSQTIPADLTNLTIPNAGLPDFIARAGLALSADVDRSNKKSLIGLKLRTGGAALLSANLFVGNDMLALQVPELYDSYLTVPTSDFVNKWNQSPISGMTMKIEQDIDIENAFDLIYGEGGPVQDVGPNPLPSELLAVFSSYYSKTVIKNSGKQTVELPDGNSVQLAMISVSFTQTEFKNMLLDACNTVIDNTDTFARLQEQYGYMPDTESVKRNITDSLNKISFPDPVVFGIYCDSRHRIVYVSLDTNIISADTAGQNTQLFTGVSLTGVKRLGDNVTVSSRIKNAQMAYRMQITSDTSASDGSYYENILSIGIDDDNINRCLLNSRIKASYDGSAGSDNFSFSGTASNCDNDFSISLNAVGNIDKNDNAKSLKADFSDLSLTSTLNNETISVAVKGAYSLAAITENVSEPADAKDVLSLDEMQLFIILQQVYGKISSIPAFSDILGNMFF